MTQRKPRKPVLKRLRRRAVDVDFQGGCLTSDAGLLLLRQVDAKLGLLDAINDAIPDPRDPRYIVHPQRQMLASRILAIAAGYEDENDHQQLRFDPALQVAAEKDPQLDDPLASPSTLCRLENRVYRKTMARLHEVLVEQFLDSYDTPPEQITLDFDATDDPTYGQQEGRFFHGYYRSYCYLPLYVFCGSHPLVAYLRSSNIDAAKHARAIVKLLVTRIRGRWPNVTITIRADSGFCRWKLMRSCDRLGVKYIFGLAKNSRLHGLAAELKKQAEKEYEATGQKQRDFTWIRYAAGSWDRERHVVAKAEHGSRGENPRFVVTNLFDEMVPVGCEASPAVDPGRFYDEQYCVRGEMENRIKEQQLCLFADRTSCRDMLANQFRLLLSTFAYVLVDGLRRLALRGTDWSRARCDTIRLRLIKIAARVRITARRVVYHLASNCPSESIFRQAMERLCDSS
jgi:hypothetical protein